MSNMSMPPSGLAEDILRNITEGPGNDLHLVTFSLGEEFGVPIAQVQEIIRVGGITAVPNSPLYMEGVINIRGKILPVLNLRRKLSLPEVEATKDSRIVVTEVNEKLLGLLVDSVSHVLKAPAGQIEAAPEEVLDMDTDYITGVCKLGERLVILLDLERLLRREKLETNDGATSPHDGATATGQEGNY